jgi:hypothetical protein
MNSEMCDSKKYVIPLTPSCDFGKNGPIEIIINNYCCESCKHFKKRHKRHHKRHHKRCHKELHEKNNNECDKSNTP